MNDTTLGHMNKQVKASANRTAFQLLSESSVHHWISFIVGYPGDTPELFADTRDFLVNEYAGHFALYVFMLNDETMPVWQDAERFGLLPPCGGRAARHSHTGCGSCRTPAEQVKLRNATAELFSAALKKGDRHLPTGPATPPCPTWSPSSRVTTMKDVRAGARSTVHGAGVVAGTQGRRGSLGRLVSVDGLGGERPVVELYIGELEALPVAPGQPGDDGSGGPRARQLYGAAVVGGRAEQRVALSLCVWCPGGALRVSKEFRRRDAHGGRGSGGSGTLSSPGPEAPRHGASYRGGAEGANEFRQGGDEGVHDLSSLVSGRPCLGI